MDDDGNLIPHVLKPLSSFGFNTTFGTSVPVGVLSVPGAIPFNSAAMIRIRANGGTDPAGGVGTGGINGVNNSVNDIIAN